MTQTSRVTAVAIVPFALALHNVEEAMTFRAAVPDIEKALSHLLGRSLALPAAHQFYFALGVVTALGFGLLVLAWRWTPAAYALVVLQAVMTLNVGAHLLGGIVLRGYVPGLYTALFIEAPTSVLVFRQLRREPWLSRTQWVLLLPLAVLFHGPALLALLSWVRAR